MSRKFLRRMAAHVEGHDDAGQDFGEDFHQLCRLSLTNERAIERLINMTPVRQYYFENDGPGP